MAKAETLCDSILLINKGKSIINGKLAHIRTQHRSHAIGVELEGDTGFIKTLAMVKKVESNGNRLEITLAEEADSQQLLRGLIARVRVLAFELKVPSLHEIFVNLVGASNEEDS